MSNIYVLKITIASFSNVIQKMLNARSGVTDLAIIFTYFIFIFRSICIFYQLQIEDTNRRIADRNL